MKPKKQWIGKTVLLLVLIMTVIGFTLPSVLDNNSQSQVKAEPRVCQNDAECYLTCDDKPVMVLCSQNLCQQNSCKEANYYEFNQNPITFTLAAEIEGKRIDLTNQSSTKDLFVKLENEKVAVFTSGLNMNQVLEKVKAKLTTECLIINGANYCRSESKELKFMVNGNQLFAYGNYVPQDEDKIEIIY